MPEIKIYPKFALVKPELEPETTCNSSKILEENRKLRQVPDKCTNCSKLAACILADIIRRQI